MNPLPWQRPNATEAYATERLGSRDHDLAFPWASRIDIARLAAMQAAVQQLWQRYDLPYFAEENSAWQKDLNALLLAAAGQRLNSRCCWRTPLSLCRQLLAGLAWAISCRSPVLEALSV